MALTLNNFTGVETGGLEEFSIVDGSPVADSATVRSGAFSVRCPGDDVTVNGFTVDEEVASAGTDFIVGFGVRFTDLTPSASWTMVRGVDSGGNSQIGLALNTSGDLLLLDSTDTTVLTISAPFTVNTFHYIELYWVASNTGAAEVFIDNVSEGSVASEDFLNGTFSEVDFTNPNTGEDVFYDDIYLLSGATGASDRLTPAEVFTYQNTAEDATDQGDTLDNGTWALVSETPLDEGTANDAQYNANAARDGHTITDEGTRSGPSGDSNIDGDIKGIKGIWRLRRGNGSGTTHQVNLGNSGDGVTATSVSLTTSYQTFQVLSEAATVVPLATEFCAIGFNKSSGGREIFCGDQWAMLLHVPASGPVVGAQSPYQDPIFKHRIVR